MPRTDLLLADPRLAEAERRLGRNLVKAAVGRAQQRARDGQIAPPALTRRGASAAAGRELAAWPDPPSAADLLRRHGFLRAGALAAMGVAGGPQPVAGDWLADPGRWASLRGRLAEMVAAHARRDPLAIGMAPEAARAALGLPDRALVEALAQGIGVRLEDGYLRSAGSPAARDPATGDSAPSLPPRTAAAVTAVLADLAGAPFLGSGRAGPGGRGPGPAAAAVHHRRGQAGARHHPAGRDPAAGIPGPGRDHPAPARRPPPPAVKRSLVHPRAVRVSSRKPTAGRKAR